MYLEHKALLQLPPKIKYMQFLNCTKGNTDLLNLIKYWFYYDVDNSKIDYLETLKESKDRSSLNSQHSKTKKAVHWICTLIHPDNRSLLVDVNSDKWLSNVTPLLESHIALAKKIMEYKEDHSLSKTNLNNESKVEMKKLKSHIGSHKLPYYYTFSDNKKKKRN